MKKNKRKSTDKNDDQLFFEKNSVNFADLKIDILKENSCFVEMDLKEESDIPVTSLHDNKVVLKGTFG